MGIVDSILSSVKRCSDVTRRLLNFARNTDGETTPVDLAETVTEVLGFMGKEADYRSIEVEGRYRQRPPRTQTNCGRLQQILLNLINNAFAAVDDGGWIKISASESAEDSVTILVRDNGCGMTGAGTDEGLRAVLHHQEKTRRHRARPVDHLLPGPGTGRHDRRRKRAWRGNAFPRHSSVGQGGKEGKPMRVLLVDDEEELVTALAERLSYRGIEADWSTTGRPGSGACRVLRLRRRGARREDA